MRISEQTSKKFKRVYYHGYRSWHDKNLRVCPEFYLTTNFVYACTYAGEDGTVDSFMLTEDLDIFNAQSKKDYDLLKTYIENYNPELTKYLPRLKKEDWSFGNPFDQRIKLKLIEILKILKFDGYFNYEVDEELFLQFKRAKYAVINPVMLNNPSIGIFDENKLTKIDSKTGMQEFEKESSFQNYKEKEKDFIKYRMLKLYDEGKFGVLSIADEIRNLSDQLFTFDENEIEQLVNDWDLKTLVKDKENLFKKFNYLYEKTNKRWPIISDYYTEGYHLAEKICSPKTILNNK